MPALALVRRTLKTTALAAALSATLALPAFAQTTVKAVLYSPLRLLDPVANGGYVTQNHAYMIYDTLFALDANQKVQPQMVEKWEVSPDNKVYKFTLRPGLKWHDGTPVKAEDCVASIKRWAEVDKMGQVMMSFMKEMKATGDSSFEMVFETANGLVLPALSKPRAAAYMMQKRIVDATPATQPVKEHIGSGPFRFVTAEFKPGVQVVYEKNKDYVPRKEPASWLAGSKQANVDRVVWLSMPDHVTTVNALLNGEIDYMELVPYDLLPMVEGKPNIKVDTVDNTGQLTFFRFNFSQPPFNNKAMRQAAIASIDRGAIMKALVGNPKYYRACGSIYGCSNSSFTSNAGAEVLPSFDAAKAQAVTKQAGYNGPPLVILQPTDVAVLAPQPLVIAQSLRKAGWKVDLQSSDFQTFMTRRVNAGPVDKGGWNMFHTNLGTLDLADPIRALPVATNGAKAWNGWPDFADIEELRQKFARTPDLEEQKRIAGQIQKRVLEEGVMVPAGQFFLPTAFRTSLQNVVYAPIPVFWGMSKPAQN
ncbi:ABC transporter substrate-binding protein [Piscinibacter sakaiensis]|uniref:Dipeptide-binding ABC transporter, periplasmic substrate-binding component n=1 Tax=Piscinibacter sakaiensis TaxID=1547922 RepID=A0A0K8NYM3_PISS1|nr:ABC transporter substrate-binding protein [Piscinibacter sakaiensis]GAP35399.1 dipeptide-binding ABC transporter, periplasmic substrate-binding component [Piscinibacter sakaiensis]